MPSRAISGVARRSIVWPPKLMRPARGFQSPMMLRKVVVVPSQQHGDAAAPGPEIDAVENLVAADIGVDSLEAEQDIAWIRHRAPPARRRKGRDRHAARPATRPPRRGARRRS